MPLPPRIARQIERPLWGPLLAYAVAQAFFLYTIAPTLLWGDDAKFQWMAYLRDTRAGAAYDHPSGSSSPTRLPGCPSATWPFAPRYGPRSGRPSPWRSSTRSSGV